MTSRRLTFYLMNDAIADFSEALAPDKPHTEIALAESSMIDGRFYYAPPKQSTPTWVSFVQPVLAQPLGGAQASSVSGLLLIRASARIFALTFGYGRSLLNLAMIEHQFGLRVALNRIDPSQLRSLDTKTFEDMVVTTNKQVSKSADLPTFRVDVSTDILKAATGEPRDPSFAKRLSGSDALVMNIESDPTDLPDLCSRLLGAFGEEHYKSDFGWIDHLALVRRVELLGELNDLLVDDLTKGGASTTHLAMPESINWEDVDAFKIGGTQGHIYDDLDLDTYLGKLGTGRSSITLQNLKSRLVSIRFGRSDNFDHRWSLYQCIVSEQRLNGALYALIEGRWFAVSQSLVEEVDRFVSSIPESKDQFISARPGEVEGDYNQRLAESQPSKFLKMDARIKRPGGASSGIELCDVLTTDGNFIHVKRKVQSSTLSHLFAQGNISATTFVNDGHFRQEIRELMAREVAPTKLDDWLDLVPGKDNIVDRSRKYCVTYAVVANSNRSGADWLPFFSKLNLMQHGQRLINLGFSVALSRIPIVAV